MVRTLATTRERLLALGHKVEVVAPHQYRNVPLPSYPEIRLALCSPKSFGNIFLRHNPEAVHIATEGPLGWSARAWLKKNNIAFTTSFHTMFPQYLKMRTGAPESFGFAILKRFHSAAGATMYSTPTLKTILEKQSFTNLVRWKRGVDTKLFCPGSPASLPYTKPIQMYVGRVAVEKTLESFLNLDTSGTKIIIGEGPQLPVLKKKYPDVKFLGPKYDEELVEHYRAADVFVFPSRTDTLGLVMLEALACGVPVAGFPVQGPIDVIGNSAAGVLKEDLEKAISEAIGIDPNICRSRALEHSWEASADEFHDNLIRLNNPST